MKNIVAFVLGVIAIGCIVLYFRGNQDTVEYRKALDVERYNRMVSEEQLQKTNGRVAQLESELNNAEGKLSKVQDILEKERALSEDLEAQVKRIQEAKSALEKELARALSAASEMAEVSKVNDVVSQ